MEEKISIENLKKQFIDGIIFISGYNSSDHISTLVDNEFPVVILDREIEEKKVLSVLINNFEAMSKVVDYLYKLGHKRIGYVTYTFKNQTTVEKRFRRYCKGLKDRNSYDPNIVIINDNFRLNEIQGSYDEVKKIFDNKNFPTAINCF